MSEYIEAYTKSHKIYIPEIEITEVKEGQVVSPLRGYAYTAAVIDKVVVDGVIKVYGYIKATTLGYDTIRDWMYATYWEDVEG